VGISGREGLQAVNASDFAIAQFRFLGPLLLVHGHWSYRRMSKVFLYSFFKNTVITLTLFYFNVYTGWSGTSLYESLVYSGFNFFLGLPIIAVGIFDRCVADSWLSTCCLAAPPSLSPSLSPYLSPSPSLSLSPRSPSTHAWLCWCAS
jgi:magnesium-transporting ATPase (P-type)